MNENFHESDDRYWHTPGIPGFSERRTLSSEAIGTRGWMGRKEELTLNQYNTVPGADDDTFKLAVYPDDTPTLAREPPSLPLAKSSSEPPSLGRTEPQAKKRRTTIQVLAMDPTKRLEEKRRRDSINSRNYLARGKAKEAELDHKVKELKKQVEADRKSNESRRVTLGITEEEVKPWRNRALQQLTNQLFEDQYQKQEAVQTLKSELDAIERRKNVKSRVENKSTLICQKSRANAKMRRARLELQIAELNIKKAIEKGVEEELRERELEEEHNGTENLQASELELEEEDRYATGFPHGGFVNHYGKEEAQSPYSSNEVFEEAEHNTYPPTGHAIAQHRRYWSQ